MKGMTRLSTAMTALLLYICTASAQGQYDRIVFGNEAADTTRLTEILIEATAPGKGYSGPQSYMPLMASKFTGTPYRSGTLEGEEEKLRINLDGMDCTTYVETVMALALTAGEGRSSWRDFAYNLERLRYRHGRLDGYASRLHYVTDWALDNCTLGLIKEVTDRIGRTDRMVKSLDWITAHRNDYPALADEEVYRAMKDVENGYHGHRMLYIKSSNIGGAALKEGDIIALVSKKEGLDVSHMGIIKMEKGTPYLLHASQTAGKVTVESRPLADYLRRMRDVAGIRVFRLSGD